MDAGLRSWFGTDYCMDISLKVRSFGLSNIGVMYGLNADVRVRLLGDVKGGFDLSTFVDRTLLAICAKSPMEYAVAMSGKPRLGYLCVTKEGNSRSVGVIIKKRLVGCMERLH